MILYPPVRFDENEWFLIVSTAILWILLLLLPKKLPFIVIVGLWLFNNVLAQSVDFLIGIKPFDWYDVNDRPQFEWFDAITYFLTYPPVIYFAMIGWFCLRWKGTRLFFYLAGCALVTVGLEWLAVRFHVFTYIHWTLWASFPVYLLVYWLNVRFLLFVERVHGLERQT
jgi:hypothetical protein